jgi:hypothetical protein
VSLASQHPYIHALHNNFVDFFSVAWFEKDNSSVIGMFKQLCSWRHCRQKSWFKQSQVVSWIAKLCGARCRGTSWHLHRFSCPEPLQRSCYVHQCEDGTGMSEFGLHAGSSEQLSCSRAQLAQPNRAQVMLCTLIHKEHVFLHRDVQLLRKAYFCADLLAQ